MTLGKPIGICIMLGAKYEEPLTTPKLDTSTLPSEEEELKRRMRCNTLVFGELCGMARTEAEAASGAEAEAASGAEIVWMEYLAQVHLDVASTSA